MKAGDAWIVETNFTFSYIKNAMKYYQRKHGGRWAIERNPTIVYCTKTPDRPYVYTPPPVPTTLSLDDAIYHEE